MAGDPAFPKWVKPRRYPDLRDDGVLLEGRPDKALVAQFVRYGKRRLFINYALGSDIADLDFLADFGSHLEGLDVIHGAIDDAGLRHCNNLLDLSLNTRRSGVLDWQPLSRLGRLFAYGGALARAASTLSGLTTFTSTPQRCATCALSPSSRFSTWRLRPRNHCEALPGWRR